MMRAVEISGAGPDGRLRLVDRPLPDPGPAEVLIEVGAAGLNRGDLYQIRGEFPPPPGASDVPGLEVSGHIAAIGAEVTEWQVGDRICALLPGGGYASHAIAHQGHCLPLARGFSLQEGAALPEAAFAGWMALGTVGKLSAGESVLIHGGGSGIGTFAIQLARKLGARVIVTAGTAATGTRCLALGADVAINYRTGDFCPTVLEATGGRGCDLVLDMVAGDYVARNISVLAPYGRHVTIGVMGGSSAAAIPMNIVLSRNLMLAGATLRGRNAAQKQALRDAVLQQVWPSVEAGDIRPVVHAAFPLDRAAEALDTLAAGGHFGKIVLDIGPER